MPDANEISRLEVGTRYPENPPPIDAVNLTFEIVGESHQHDNHELPIIMHWEPVFKIWLASPVAWETRALKNTCLAYGLYAEPDYPNGLPIFIFDGGDGQFIIKAPLVADPRTVTQWISGGVSNGIRFYLMERQTGVVQTVRVIGMEESFLRAIQKVWATNPTDHLTALQRYGTLVSTNGDGKLWKAARKWVFDQQADIFIET